MKCQLTCCAREGDRRDHLGLINWLLNERFQATKRVDPRGYLDNFESRFETHCLEIAQELGARFAIGNDGAYQFSFVEELPCPFTSEPGCARNAPSA